MAILYGTKIRLRPITLADTNNIVIWRNSPSVRANFIFRDELTPEMHIAWYNNKILTGKVVQYIIEETTATTACPIGSAYLRDIDENSRSAEYGIFIGEPSARGKGYGTETTQLLTHYGFESLRLNKITLRVLASNYQAYKSYRNAGFLVEGVAHDMFFLDGRFEDIVFMARFNPQSSTAPQKRKV